jgi:universal stress protein A
VTKKISRILAATDFSEGSRLALQYANMLRGQTGAALHVLHVVEDPTITGMWPDVYLAQLPDLRAELVSFARASLTAETRALRLSGVTTEIAVGPAAQVIAAMAEHHRSDLIVMGTHGRTGLSHVLLGSVAERVVRLAPCPVLTVRAPRAAKGRSQPRRRRAA